MDDAFQRLDKLTPEEALMAAAEMMTVTRDIDDTVKAVDEKAGRIEMSTKSIGDKVEDVDGKVQGVNEKAKDIDERVKGVDDRVGSMIQGRYFFPALAPESVLTHYSFRCKGDRSSDPTGVQSS